MRMMKRIYIFLMVAVIVAGCASGPAKPNITMLDPLLILPPVGTADMSPDEVARVLGEVEERNRTVENDEAWIESSYKGLMVRRLTNVSQREFPMFSRYLDNETAYIIIHPSFFSFFHYPKRLTPRNEQHKMMNVVERLLTITPTNYEFALLQAQERRMRDFIEFMSTNKRLLILVVPKDYVEYAGYSYRKDNDEYMRYLNEVTNLSESVLFVESKSPNRGYLTDEDALRLMEFLESIQAKRIYVGGGYVGRCLEDFYTLLTQEFGEEGIFVVPELSDISPRELNNQLAHELLRPDGSINNERATQMITTDKFDVVEHPPKIMNLR